MTVVVKPAAVNRFTVADRDTVFRDTCVVKSTHVLLRERNGFYPVNHILENESAPAKLHRNIHRNLGVFETAADVEIKRSGIGKNEAGGSRNPIHPGENAVPGHGIVVGGVGFLEVIGRRGDNDINLACGKPVHTGSAVAVMDSSRMCHGQRIFTMVIS